MSEPSEARWDGEADSEAPFRWGRARRVEGGIRARSSRGAIGESWWSVRFLAVLESFALGSRLTRGRSYARAGQVLALEVRPGEVTATVQGSRPKPYATRIACAPLSDPAWASIERALTEQALFAARLLAGELPAEIETVFAEAGASLFPTAFKDLALSCNCPDSAVPCKHLAATCYLLAETFDTDPFLILYWRGRARDELLARLSLVDDAGREDAVRPVGGAALALGDLASAAATNAGGTDSAAGLDRYWWSPVPLPDRPPATLAADRDVLLRQLPTPPAELGGIALAEALRTLYQELG